MRLTASERAIVKDKYGGRCAYCGSQLQKLWHADHLEPLQRRDWLNMPPVNPQNHHIENMMPACAPCNISKGSMPLETWREWVAGHINSLNQYHSIYRLAKSFGLLTETGAPVRFYFETYKGEARTDAA